MPTSQTRSIPSNVPTAAVKKFIGQVAYVICPYCGHEHRHERVKQNHNEWRAPGCALYGTDPKQRELGYQFNTGRNAS